MTGALPLARVWSQLRLEPWLGAETPGVLDAGASLFGTGAFGAAAAALLGPLLLAGLARLGAPILSLFTLALAAGAVGGGITVLAAGLVDAGWHPLLAVVLAWPPHALAALAAGVLATTAGVLPGLGEREALREGALVRAAAGLAAIGALGAFLGHGAWVQWVLGLLQS